MTAALWQHACPHCGFTFATKQRLSEFWCPRCRNRIQLVEGKLACGCPLCEWRRRIDRRLERLDERLRSPEKR